MVNWHNVGIVEVKSIFHRYFYQFLWISEYRYLNMIYYKGARNKRIISHVKCHHSLVHKDIGSLQNYPRLAVTWQNTLPSYSLFTLPTYASANSCLLQTQVTSTTGYYREEKVTWNVRHLCSVFIESYSIFILHGIHHTARKEKTSVNVSRNINHFQGQTFLFVSVTID